jgi:aryl-alcohol dehydrogenase-like predicted oxidoreductase
MQILTSGGKLSSCLGLAAYPGQSQRCVERAFESGLNFFFFYGPGNKSFAKGLKPLVQSRREEIILASGSGSRTPAGLRMARRKIVAAVGGEMIDVFFAEYINPDDDLDAVFGSGGALDVLQQWKADGSIRFVGASTHDRKLARKLAKDSRVDVLMHRFNMAHRKAVAEVFPTALAAQTPVVAFTATRWGTLLEPQPAWSGQPPTAVDCYRYCLAQPAVRLVLTAPKTLQELEENATLLKLPPMSDDECRHWEQFGDIIYRHGGGSSHGFESRWP